MTITDSWLNPLVAGGSISALGYREDLEEFPHDLYSYYLSSIRDADIKDVRLLWRWLYGMQLEWERIYGKILNLPLLYSPDDCPAELLDYLRHNIGITDDLDYFWGELNENEQRRLLKYFVYFLTIRSTAYGFEKMIENMTGDEVEIITFFWFRWLLSGDEVSEMEGALGREDLGYDPWMISEASVVVGVIPDSVSVVTIGSNDYYEFGINSFIVEVLDTEPPTPYFHRITYRPTRVSLLATRFYDSGWKVRAPANEYFGQTSAPYNDDVNDFRIGMDPDPFVFDIRIVDDGTVNHDLMQAIARFGRPMSERIYIRYYLMIEHFNDEDNDQWDEISGTSVIDYDDDNTLTLADVSADSVVRNNTVDADEWTDYSLSVKAQNGDVSKYFEIRFYWQDSDNYLYLRVTPGVPPILPAGTWRIGKVVATADSALATGDLDWFDIDVDYFWRVVCVESGSNVVIQIFQDEILLSSGNYTSPWATPKGQFELVGEANGEVVVSYVDVHNVPMESDYVGP